VKKVVPIDGDKIRLPGPTDRITIIGPTGSGKTHAAMWHLSNASFTSRPFVVIDPKREELVSQIEGANYIPVGEIPKYPGIYVVNPIPSDAPMLDKMLIDIWDKENIGVWIDEGLMFGTGDGIDACFTQGRSKRIPMIMLMQRPVWVSRFAVSEATFIQYFGLSDKRDRQTVQAFAENLTVDAPLKKYHSFYYDVSRKQNYLFKPMPTSDKILSTINSRLDAMKPQRKII
jgi:hypothetical protein